MNTFIWRNGGLEPFEVPQQTFMMEDFSAPCLQVTPQKETVFSAEKVGFFVRFRKNQRRERARMGTRGRRGSRPVAKNVCFWARVYVETKAHLPQAQDAIEAIAYKALDISGIPGWVPAQGMR